MFFWSVRFFSSKKSEFKRVTHVIFDMDGLLLDTEQVYANSIQSIARKFGKTYTPEIKAKVVGTVATESARIAVQEMKLPITPEDFLKEFISRAYEVFKHKVDFMPGAQDLVRHLHYHRVPIAVGTSSSKGGFELKTSQHKDFLKFFSHFVTGESDPEVRKGKPSPDIFLVCASRFKDKPAPENCLVFEDSVNGVIAARSAGMQAVMVPDKDISNCSGLCDGATLVLNSLEEFKPELFGLPPFTK